MISTRVGQRLGGALVSLSILLSGLLGTAPTRASDLSKPNLFGIALNLDWRSDFDAIEQATGRYPAFQQLYWPIEAEYMDWSKSGKFETQGWTTDMLTALHSRGITAYIEVQTFDVPAFLAGDYDTDLGYMVSTITGWLAKDPSHRILLSPLPEANNRKHPWGGDPDAYKAAYRKIRAAFLASGIGPDQMRFIFGINGLADLSYPHYLNGYADFYPGDAEVDIIGFSKINRGDPEWRDYERNFQMHIDELKNTVSTQKPILITQTGSVDNGPNGETRARWLQDMFTGLQADDQVIGSIYFNRLIPEDPLLGGPFDLRVIIEGDLEQAVVDGIQSWSPPSEVAWIFDGSMDQWVASRPDLTIDPPRFTDTLGSVFADDIDWLAETGITKGCNPPSNDRFCPDLPVTRGQMAAFLVRALGFTDRGSVDFVDDDNSIFEADIEKLAAAGITRGCNPPTNDRFCPDSYVTRGQMAAFLRRALDR